MKVGLKKIAQKFRVDRKHPAKSAAFSDFPMLAPKSFMLRVKNGDKKDPLLLQVLPQLNELKMLRGYDVDPLNEAAESPIPGLIHRYYGRVLLLVSDKCALNCRFCFRRHIQTKISDWEQVFSYISADRTISEVILSGGDPLMLSRDELSRIIKSLESISHIKRLRIHSRVPIAAPNLVTSKLPKSKLPITLVIHCNHPNEINEDVAKAIKILRKHNIVVFNQSVLLRGINDNPNTLSVLSEKLYAIGVIPYYLHMLDKVMGSSHFYVEQKRAKFIHVQLKKKLPGYLVPKLVVEVKNAKKYI